ncbi:ArsR/SmtB family transcription factor [Paenibacillus sp. GCM10027628]|uniref:ArsR/SmtB family transcription factor n=1 Tax=Paenibacillus sp. GCM10027628 TaxID=3273413 RepID=UPI00362C7864
MRTLYHPDLNEMKLTTVLYALSDQIRLDIIKHLDENGEKYCASLVMPIPSSTLSHHYKVLRESGVTATRLEGTQRFISIRYDDLNTRFPGLLPAILHALKSS